MLLTVPQIGRPGRFPVTLDQWPPESRVTCSWPSLVPAQIRPFSIGDSAIANTTPAYSTPMLSGVRPPELCWRALSLSVKSGLMTCQLWPALMVRWTYWLPAYTVLRSCGDNASGKVQLKRYFKSPAGTPTVVSGQISTSRAWRVRSSKRSTVPPRLPNPVPVDQTMLLSTGSGIAQPLSPPATECQSPRGIGPASASSDCLPIRLWLGPRVDGPS